MSSAGKILVFWREPIAMVLITILVVACYAQTIGHSFFWDTNHIFMHEEMREFSWDSIAWLFTNTVNANWHPITLFTHIIDFSLFGWNPAGHHLTNLLLHALVSIAVYFTIRELVSKAAGNQPIVAFFVAALTALFFALHPLRVESVAWVAARKDLLYSLFYLLAVTWYVRYTDRSTGRWRAYIVSLTFFLAALLSKSMAVTLPALLVLLDYYPLGKLQPTALKQYIKDGLPDKLPYVLFALVIIVITFATQSHAMPDERLGQLDQLRNTLHNIVFYLDRFVVPVGLSPFYPFPEPEVFYAVTYWLPQLVFIVALTAAVVYLASRGHMLLLVCWGAYLVMLAPASGIIHVGSAAAADRYTYLTLLPFCLLTALGVVYFWQSFPALRRVTVAVVVLGVITLGSLTFMQTRHWQTPLTLWSHVLRLYPDAAVAHRNISVSYQVVGMHDEAIAHLHYLAERGWPVARVLADAYQVAGRTETGVEIYRELLASETLTTAQRETYQAVVNILASRVDGQ